MQVHKARCRHTVLLYYAHGHKPEDWTSSFYQSCPWQCPGTGMSMAVTHNHDCEFWNHTEETPL